jgi:hypothetical protein
MIRKGGNRFSLGINAKPLLEIMLMIRFNLIGIMI